MGSKAGGDKRIQSGSEDLATVQKRELVSLVVGF